MGKNLYYLCYYIFNEKFLMKNHALSSYEEDDKCINLAN